MAVIAKDINGKNIEVGTAVAVRCKILSFNPVNAGDLALGSGDSITVQVLTPGNVGEVNPGPIFTISPVQCQFSQSNSQLKGS
jgi:hypothetical protein